MQIERKNICPLKDKPCIGLDCAWATQLRGSNPQTGADIDEWGCAVTWLPILLIENAKESRQTGAAVESFRNEMVQANQTNLQVLAMSSNLQKLIGDLSCG